MPRASASKKTTHEVQDEVIDPGLQEIQDEAQEIATEAKKSFSLKSFIAGAKYGKTTVAFLLDADLANTHATLDEQSKALARMYEEAKKRGVEGEELETHLRRFNEVDAARETAYQALLASALFAHLTGVPAALLDSGVRKAAKYLGIKRGSTLTEEENQALDEELAFQNFQTTLVKIVDAQGNEAQFNESELRHFRQGLPYAQRTSLNQAVDNLLFRNVVAQSAITDPGF